MTAKQYKRQQLAQMVTDTRTRLDAAAVQGAALRGELGGEAQLTVLQQLSAEYKAAKAAGNDAEAKRIKDLVFALVPMK